MANRPSSGGNPSRHTSKPEAKLAGKVLSGSIKPTAAQSKSLAASVLSQNAPKKGK